MPEYSLIERDRVVPFEASDDSNALRKAARRLTLDIIESGSVEGPDGTVWTLAYDGYMNGLSGWMFSTGDGSPGSVFDSFPGVEHPLAEGGWQGLYALEGGSFVHLSLADMFDSDDFSLLGAVEFTVYDGTGEIGNGWYGFDEETPWEQFDLYLSEVVGFNINEQIMECSDPLLPDLVGMLAHGTPHDEVLLAMTQGARRWPIGASSPRAAASTTPSRPARRRMHSTSWHRG